MVTVTERMKIPRCARNDSRLGRALLNRVRLAGLALFAAACRAEQPPPAGDSTTTTVAASTPQPPTIPADWHSVGWEPYAGVDPTDLGLGVVFLRRAEDKSGTIGTDTLIVHSAPNEASSPLGALLFVVSANGVTSYQVAAPDSLTPNLVEYGYEESGIPFDSIDATGHWLRTLLGSTADGAMRAGWVDTAHAGVGTVRWTDQLRDRPIFFPKPDRAAFFATPDSTTPVAAPRGDDDAYAMHPVEVRGPWMRVRVVTPSDNCEPDPAARRTRELWIRYLDDRGRPNVWYYTRGC